MPTVPFTEFKHECNKQEIELHPALVAAAISGESGTSFTHEPTANLAAIAMAGRLLRWSGHNNSADIKLANQKIQLTPETSGDLVVEALATVINHSIEPYQPTIHEVFWPENNASGLSICQDAEGYFAMAAALLMGLETSVLLGQEPPKGIADIEVIIDSDGDPVILRKGINSRSNIGEPTSLALKEVIIGGVLFPAGSILNVEGSIQQGPYRNGPSSFIASPGIFQVRPVRDYDKASFLRLSAYGLPPTERFKHFSASDLIGGENTAVKRLFIEDHSLSFIKEITAGAMKQAEMHSMLQLTTV